MKRRPAMSAGALSRLLETVRDAWQRQDFQQCIDLLERASRIDPANAGVLLDLGRAHGTLCNFDEADRCYDKAVRVAALKAEALTMAGLHCRDTGRFDRAAAFLEEAVRQPGAPPDTLVKLSELFERLRRLDEASDLIERALRIEANLPMALLARARLDRLAGRLAESEQRLRPLLVRTDEDSWSTRVRGWYELGANLDRQCRYDEAMAAFLEAKALLRRRAEPHIAAQRKFHLYLRQAETEITPDVFRRWADESISFGAPQSLALLCGHPRSGTTLLEQVLDSHPDIVSVEETEIFHIRAYTPLKLNRSPLTPMRMILDSAAPDVIRRSRADYIQGLERFLGTPADGRLLIDKNPSLTTLIPAAVRIFPEIRVLVAVRDPRDVCLSCFMQPLPLNHISSAYLTLEGTVEEYGSVMGFWRALAPRLPNPQIEVRYEDVVEDLETESRRTLEFLGKQWDDRVLRFDEHARQKLVRSPTYADVTKPVFKGSVGRWRHYEKYFKPLAERFEPWVRVFGYD